MIKRIVENWLTKTNERRYEIPFCQLLDLQGYKIVHKTTHGASEQGKDILTRDSKGVACGFQLKTGDINKNEWHKIHGGVVELIELPFDHPSFRIDEPRRAVLVTNGALTEDVRTTITSMNRLNVSRKFPELEIKTGVELVHDFVAAQGDYLPRDPGDWQRFLNLCAADGRHNLREEEFAKFLEDVLLQAAASRTGTRALRDIVASSLLLSTYVLGPHSARDNHLALAKGYVILAAHIMALALKEGLNTEVWESTFNLCWDGVLCESQKLKQEVFKKNNALFEGDHLGDGGSIYRTRVVLTLGWLSAIELMRAIREPGYAVDLQVAKLVRENFPSRMECSGEYVIPYFFAMALLVEKGGDTVFARAILAEMATLLAMGTSGKNPAIFGVPDPYWTPDELLMSALDMRDPLNPAASPLDSSPLQASFTLSSLIEALARRDERQTLEKIWYFATHLMDCGFAPEPAWKVFTWRCENGEQRGEPFQENQSYAQLVAQANKLPVGIPDIVTNRRWLIPPFLLTYPHRMNRHWARKMDS